MCQEESFRCMNNEKFAIAEFPYGNEAFSMVVVLPVENSSLEESLLWLSMMLGNNARRKCLIKNYRLKCLSFLLNIKSH